MRIAMFADTFFPAIDGVVSSMTSVARALSKRGHQVRFFVPKPAQFEKARELSKEFDVVWVKSLGLPTYGDYRISPPLSFQTHKAFVEFNPDIVHVHTPFSLGWMGIRFAREKKIPVVATYHTLLPEFLMYMPLPWLNKTALAKELTWKYTRAFYRNANLVTTPTQPMADELHKNRIAAVALSNPIRFELFHRFAAIKRSKAVFRLVFFGRLSFEKNIEVVLSALSILRAQSTRVELELIGSGPAESMLKSRVRELKLDSCVKFLGVLRDEALAKKVAQCHVLVTASTIETQGLTILEAMAAGVPCVGADFLGIPNAVRNGKNGFLFEPFNAVAAAQQISMLMTDSKRFARFSKAAIQTAKKSSEERVVREYESHYKKLISTSSK